LGLYKHGTHKEVSVGKAEKKRLGWRMHVIHCMPNYDNEVMHKIMAFESICTSYSLPEIYQPPNNNVYSLTFSALHEKELNQIDSQRALGFVNLLPIEFNKK
jgi:hypothetical protein